MPGPDDYAKVTIGGRVLDAEESEILRQALKYWARRFEGRAEAKEAKVRRLEFVRTALKNVPKAPAHREAEECAVRYRRVEMLADFLLRLLTNGEPDLDGVREVSQRDLRDGWRYEPIWGFTDKRAFLIGPPAGGWSDRALERFREIALGDRDGEVSDVDTGGEENV